jgi:hypothetical protein
MNKFQCGIYKHFRGHLYQVFGVAHDANNEYRICVVYIGLEIDGASLGPRLAVRTMHNFLEWVHLPDEEAIAEPAFSQEKEQARSEGWVPRFEYLGIELTGDMLVNR